MGATVSGAGSPTSSKGLPASHRGRCRAVKRVARQCAQLPRKGRHGDFTPSFEGTSLLVRQRTRQCRRVRTFLSGFKKFSRGLETDDTLLQNLLHEWAAICRAPGYGASFSDWMLQWECVPYFPYDFPTLEWTHSALQLLEFDCQAWAAREVQVRQHSFLVASHVDELEGHSRQGFKALKPRPKPPFQAVSSNIQQCVSDFQALPGNEALLAVPHPAQFRSGCPVHFDGQDAWVLDVGREHVRVLFNDPPGSFQGYLTQEIHDCTPAELHEGFRQFWSPFWSRDSLEESLQDEPWQDFAATLSRYPCPWPELQEQAVDVGLWKKVLAKSKTSGASGACGFTVRELKMLPEEALAHLARLCDRATRFGFPQCILMGRINILAKVDVPAGFNDGRPICILPVIYRLWTSVWCSIILQHWRPHMPPGVFGGVPGRSARDITYILQHDIELSHLTDSPLSGFVLDLVKCFNALPRRPIALLLKHLRCPPHLVEGWMDCLRRLQRASSFVGDISASYGATTGVPEGDGMSVVAAVGLGWLQASLLTDFGVSPMIFIDNWSWTTEDDELHAAALEQTLQLVRSLRLQIDWRKSFAWSRHVEGIRWWHKNGASLLPQGAPLFVLPEAKDLGVAMRYRAVRTLGTLKTRILEGQRRLTCLAQQPRSLKSKGRLIQAAVWPTCFYGCEGHAIGLQHLRRLRSAAARALVGPQQQMSPQLALATLVPGLQDPEVFVLVMAIRALRRAWWLCPRTAESILYLQHHASGQVSAAIGPATALKVLLCRAGWELSLSGVLKGPGNVQVSVKYASQRDVALAVEKAWCYQVRQAVSHRNGLAGVGIPDAPLTHRALACFTAAEQKILAKHVTGGFHTQAMKFRWGGAESPDCPWCGQPETRYHRFVACPAFEQLRCRHPVALEALTHVHPHWCYAPFATLPEEDDILSLVFATRPMPSMPPAPAGPASPQRQQPLVFFTDGTCANPAYPAARHAAWAVVQDTACTEEARAASLLFWEDQRALPPCFQVFDQGMVAGKQTIPRAELTAALQAVRRGFQENRRPTHIITDSSYVVKVVQAFQAGAGDEFCRTSANTDLLVLFREVWFSGVSVAKVKSHVSPAKAASSLHLWNILGNMAADEAAARARAQDLSVVQDMVAAVAAQQDEQLSMLRAVYKYLLELHAVTCQLLNAPAPSQLGDREALERPSLLAEGPVRAAWEAMRECSEPAAVLARPSNKIFLSCTWGVHFSWRLWTWLQTLQWFEPTGHASDGVTTLELLCNFVVVTCALPPLAVLHPKGGTEYLDFMDPAARLTPTPLRTWLQALTAASRQLGRLTSSSLLPPTGSRKITVLQKVGDVHARSGFRSCCRFTQLEETATLLMAVIRQASTTPLWDFVLRRSGSAMAVPLDLLQEASGVSPSRRKGLRSARQ